MYFSFIVWILLSLLLLAFEVRGDFWYATKPVQEEEKEQEIISNKSKYRYFLKLEGIFWYATVQEEGQESISNKSNYFPTSSTFFYPSLSHQLVINLHTAVIALGGYKGDKK